jgi:hypothetical protein
MKVSTENDNNFGYEKITIVVDNMLLILDILTRLLVGDLMSYSRYLCLFVYSGVQYILCCVLFFLNRSEVSSKWNKCRIYRGSVGPYSRKCYASKLALKWQRFCLIGKPSMFFPSFLNRFSYEFMMMPMRFVFCVVVF